AWRGAPRRGGERHASSPGAVAVREDAGRAATGRPHHPLRRAGLRAPRLYRARGARDRGQRRRRAEASGERLSIPVRDSVVETVDVAIVGAGPAGSTLAALLAARGLAVALIDRDAFPRDKLCGEFLSYDALPIAEALGIDLSAAPEIAHCRIVSRHRTYEFDFPHAARGVSRLFLDDALHRRAVAAGAVAITSPATAVARERVSTEAGD